MEIQRTPIKTGGYEIPTIEQLDQQEPLTSSSEATDSAMALAVQDTAVMLGQRLFSMHEMQEQTKQQLTPDQANERYPDMDVPFREPINPYVAQLQYDKAQEKMTLQKKVANGPQDAWTKTKTVGAGFVAHLMDPVEFGAGAVTGWGVGGLIGRTAWGARLAGSTTRAGQLAFDVLEAGSGNLIENAASEGLLAATESREGLEYDPQQGLANLAMSTFIGTGVGVGIKQGAKAIGEGMSWYNSRKRILQQTSPEADLVLARTTIGNLQNDIRPDATPLLETLARETDVNPKDFGKPGYDYRPALPEEIPNTKFFASTKEAVGNFADGKRLAIADDYQLGVQMTDNPGVANAAAVRSMSDSTGSVHEMQVVGEVRPLNLEQAIPVAMKDFVEKNLKYMDHKVNVDDITVKDFLDAVEQAIDEGNYDPSFRADLKAELMAKGYNALVSDGTSRLGVDHSPHNALTILDESMVKPVRALEPDKSVIRSPDEKTIKTLEGRTDFRNHTLVDGTKYDNFVQKIKEIPDTQPQAEFKAHMDEAIEEFDHLQKQGFFDANEVKQLEGLKKSITDLDTHWTLLKAVKSCVGL